MVGLLVSVIVVLVVVGLIYWAVRTLAAAFGFPPQVVAVVQVLLVIVIVLWLLSVLVPGVHLLR